MCLNISQESNVYESIRRFYKEGLLNCKNSFGMIKIRYIFAVFFLVFNFCITSLVAQDLTFQDVWEQEADSWLEKVEKGEGSKEARDLFETCLAQAESLSVEDVLSGLTKAVEQAEKDNDKLGAGLISVAIYSTASPETELSQKNLEKAVLLLDGRVDEVLIAILKTDLGVTYAGYDQYDDALCCYDEAEEIFRKRNMADKLAMIFVNKGVIFENRKCFDDALHYFEEAEKIFRVRKMEHLLAVALARKGGVYGEIAGYEEASRCFNEAEKIAIALEENDLLNTILSAKLLAYRRLGDEHLNQGRYGDALQCYADIADIYRVKNMDDELANVLTSMSELCFSMRRFEDAMTWIEEAGTIYKKKGMNERYTYLLKIKGNCYMFQNKYADALMTFEDAEEILRRIGNDEELASILGCKYNAYFNLDQIEDGLYCLEEAEHIYKMKKMDAALAKILEAKCLGYHKLERYQDVLDNADEIVRTYESLEQRAEVATVLGYKATAHQALDQFQEALQCYEEAETIYKTLGFDEKLVEVLSDKISIYEALGRYEEALVDYEKAEKIFIAHGLDDRRAEVAIYKGEIHRHLGRFEKALASFKIAKDIYETQKADKELAAVLIHMGSTNHQMGQNKKALQYFDDAEKIVQKDGPREYLGGIFMNRGLVYAALEQYEDALSSYDKAEEIFRSLDMEEELAVTRLNRGRVLNNLGRYEEALNELEEAEIIFKKYERTLELMAIFFERSLVQENMMLAEKKEPTIKDILQRESTFWAMKVLNGLGSREALAIVYDCWVNAATLSEAQLCEYQYKAAQLAERDNDSLGAGLLYVSLGVACEVKIGKVKQHHLEKAVQLFARQVSDILIAFVKNELSAVLAELGHYENALEHLVDAEEVFNRYDMKLNIGKVVENKGLVYQRLSRFTDAFDHYDKAEKIFTEIGRENKLGGIYMNKGSLYGVLGRYREALVYLGKAEKYLEGEGKEGKHAKLVENMGTANFYLSRFEDALKNYEKAEKIFRIQNLKPQLANVAANKGNVYKMLGRYEEALSKYDEAENIYIKEGMEAHCIQLLGNKAATYYELNLFDEAIKVYNEAEDFYKARNMITEIGIMNLNRGTLFLGVGRFEEALFNYIKAEDIFKEKGLEQYLGIIYQNYGGIFSLMENYEKALEYYGEAEKIFEEKGMMANLAEIHRNRGMALSFLGRYEAALEEFDKAEKIFSQRYMEAALSVLYQLRGFAYELQGNLKKAIASYKKAIDILEKVRGKIMTEEIKTSLMAGKIDVYKHLISLLVETEKYEEAFHYAERSTARSFLDLLSEREINIYQGVSEELLNQRNELLSRISWYREQLVQESFDLLEKELVEVEEALEKLERKIKMESPAYAALVYPEPLTLRQIQKNIPNEETVLLEYCVTDEEIILWVIKKHTFTVCKLDVNKEEIVKMINEYRKLIMDRERIEDLSKLSRALYNRLVKPTVSEISNIRRLIIIPDGPLHYLPFQTLKPDDDTYLLEQYRITYAPSASVLSEMDKWRGKEVPKGELIAFSVQDFSVKRGVQGESKGDLPSDYYEKRGIYYPPLTHTLDIVEGLDTLYENAVVYIDTQALEARAKSECRNFRLILFATHGVLDEEKPMYSGVLLSRKVVQEDDGFLHAYEVYNIRLNADLIVLSACRTGLGKLTKGEGLVGLSRAFMYAGSPSLVVSLWSALDISTAPLMKQFYSNLQQGLDKDESLRQAQIYLLRSEYSHPVFWAPFVLIGDWK